MVYLIKFSNKLVPGRILTFLLFRTLCKISRIVVFMFSTWNLLNPLFGTYLQKHKINIIQVWNSINLGMFSMITTECSLFWPNNSNILQKAGTGAGLDPFSDNYILYCYGIQSYFLLQFFLPCHGCFHTEYRNCL